LFYPVTYSGTSRWNQTALVVQEPSNSSLHAVEGGPSSRANSSASGIIITAAHSVKNCMQQATRMTSPAQTHAHSTAARLTIGTSARTNALRTVPAASASAWLTELSANTHSTPLRSCTHMAWDQQHDIATCHRMVSDTSNNSVPASNDSQHRCALVWPAINAPCMTTVMLTTQDNATPRQHHSPSSTTQSMCVQHMRGRECGL
jgi:hypothetical protein